MNKLIRFRHIFEGQQFNGCIPYKNDTNIIFNEITSTNLERWNYSELDDLMYAFIKTANYIIGGNYVSGYIELRNKTSLYDSYLDSDSDTG